jgi:hypothetical protein
VSSACLCGTVGLERESEGLMGNADRQAGVRDRRSWGEIGRRWGVSDSDKQAVFYGYDGGLIVVDRPLPVFLMQQRCWQRY